MEDSKIIGKLILIVGLGLAIYGGIKEEGIFGAIGGIVILVGKLIEEYGDDWFGA